MTVTRNVIRDLLPLYAAGESSADTRTLVEAWLKDDAELAAELAALQDDRPPSLITQTSKGTEMRDVIAQTRTLLRRRTLALAGALTFTALPVMGLIYRMEGVHFPLEVIPFGEGFCLLLAAGFWTMFGMTMKRMKVSGL